MQKHLNKVTNTIINSLLPNHVPHFVATGTFPCIKVDLQLDRDLAFYTNLIYIPAIFVIIAAWIITLVDKSHAAARATVGEDIISVCLYVCLFGELVSDND